MKSQFLRTSLFVSIFLFLVGIIGASAKELKTPEQYWGETGISFETVKAVFKDCNSTEKQVLACLQGVNVLAYQQQRPSRLAWAAEKEAGSPYLGEAIKSYGPLTLFALKFEQSTIPSERAQNLQITNDLRNKSVKQFFANPSKPIINFAAIVNDFAISPSVATKAQDQLSLIAGGMINSYLSIAYDPHTHLAPQSEVRDQQSYAGEVYSGIGVGLSATPGNITVNSIEPTSPAYKSGMRLGDQIIKINGDPVLGKEIDYLNTGIRGVAGTPVAIDYVRGGSAYNVSIVRAKITLPNVDFRVIADTGSSYGYIRLHSFKENESCSKVESAIKVLRKQGVKGFILDLRYNLGGSVVQAQCIGSLFMESRPIFTIKNLKTEQIKTYYSSRNDKFVYENLVVLINASTASASEILSGSLQDYWRAWIVGDRSYGKATAQTPKLWDLNKKIVIWETTSRVYEPSGRTHQIVGITPDFDVGTAPGTVNSTLIFGREKDLYFNALPPEGKTWTESPDRQRAINLIKSCVDKSGEPAFIFEQQKKNLMRSDYQLLYAEEVLTCSN